MPSDLDPLAAARRVTETRTAYTAAAALLAQVMAESLEHRGGPQFLRRASDLIKQVQAAEIAWLNAVKAHHELPPHSGL